MIDLIEMGGKSSASVAQLQSRSLFRQSQQFLVGGVNSPVRAYQTVGGIPPFIRSATGAYLVDEDGTEYIDYVGSWGPMILGHAHPSVVAAVQTAAARGLSFGAPCQLETLLAQQVCQRIPSIEKLRMVTSGTEATMTAVRLARGVTGRCKIIKFEGCYHGHADSFLIKAGSGALTLGVPSSVGVPENCIADTLIAQFNDLDSVLALFADHGTEIAAIIIEPIAGNMGLLLPRPGFIEGLRDICDHYRSLLIFDEVMTGFRVSFQGFQGISSVRPDLTTLGKILGGGLPVGAVGGSASLMEQLAPTGPVYQAGTLSGNPLAMAAGLATLTALEQPGCYDQLAEMTCQLIEGLRERARASQIDLVVNYCCGMFALFFTSREEVSRFEEVLQSNNILFARFFHGMRQRGIYLAPSPYEVGFVSLSHHFLEIERTLRAAEEVFAHDLQEKS